MSKQTINIGASPNDGTGTPLRTSFDYTNQNFTELYTAVGPSGNNIVVPGNATITGDLTVDTNVLKVDTTNNRVGIGTASPTGIFHAANLGTAGTTADNFNGYFSSANRNSNVYILAKNTEGSNLYFGDGDSNTVGAVIYDHTSNYMRFDVNGAEAARFNSTGNLVFPSAKGIDFSAVTGGTGTATANVLNDYEEGTWSPTATAPVNLTSVIAYTASYTKVGRLVTIIGYVSATVTSSNLLTYFTLPSLPFANNGITAGSAQENGNLTVGTSQVASSNLYCFFPAASAIVSGAATFYYSVTYSV